MTTNATVLLVHGTFAGATEDEGKAWWQRGSDTWKRLQKLLPEHVQLDEVFHWGVGPNSQRSRREAGLKLLERLRAFESEGRAYHLVGHSHGGSVIWACLRLAMLDKRSRDGNELGGLKSWTTVGTPFLHFDTTPAGASRSFSGWWAGYYKFTEKTIAKILPRKIVDAFYSMAAMIFPAIALLFVIAILGLLAGVGGGEAFLIGAAVVVPIAFILSLLYVGTIEQQVERFQFHREKFADRDAMRAFGPRWLGLYSADDEAINGLKAATGLQLTVVPRRVLPGEVFHADQVMRWSRPLRNFFNPLFNKFVAPAGDRFISSQIARATHGNDRPGTHVVAVSPAPVSSATSYLPIPSEISARLVNAANRGAAKVAPALRAMLGELATSEIRLSQGSPVDDLGGDALVHTGYFADDEITAMIAWHIARTNGDEASIELRPELVTWLEDFERAGRSPQAASG